MERMVQLLKEAAVHLENMGDPFGEPWLRAHEVTDEECSFLADALGLGARALAWALTHPEETGTAINGAHMVGWRRALAAISSRDLSGT